MRSILGSVLFVLLFSGCASFHPYSADLRELLASEPADLRASAKDLEKYCRARSETACAIIGKSLDRSDRLSILQGATDASSTQISILVVDQVPERFLLVEDKTLRLARPAVQNRYSHARQPGVVFQLQFTGLQANQEYRLLVLSEKDELLDVRELKTLRTDGSTLRFALVSCMDDQFTDLQERMWKQLLAQDPEVLFLIGDNVYADRGGVFHTGKADDETLWKRNVETRNALYLYEHRRLVPTYATWDDHDFGQNNGNRTYSFLESSQKIFKEFWAQNPVKGLLESGPGIASTLQLRGQRFLLLDNRSFRSPEGLPENAQNHFGLEQTRWLTEKLNDPKKPAWLISGDQFFGAYHPFESFEGNHPHAFRRFLSRLQKRARSPVIFASGDRHLTEIMKIEPSAIGYETYEITSSAIHARVYPNSFKEHPNARQIAGADGVYNYAIIESRVPENGSWKIEVSSYGEKKRRLFHEKLTVRKP